MAFVYNRFKKNRMLSHIPIWYYVEMFDKLKRCICNVFLKNEIACSLRFGLSCCCSGPSVSHRIEIYFSPTCGGQWTLVHVIFRVLHWWLGLPSVTCGFLWSSVIVFSGCQCFKAKTRKGACVTSAHIPLGRTYSHVQTCCCTGWYMWPLVGCPCAWLIVSIAEEEGEGFRSHPEMRYSLHFFPGSLSFVKIIWRFHSSLNDRDYHIYTV